MRQAEAKPYRTRREFLQVLSTNRLGPPDDRRTGIREEDRRPRYRRGVPRELGRGTRTHLHGWFQDEAGADLCGAFYAQVKRLT